MRILHIMASKARGGAETYSTDVMLSLHRENIDQCVVMPKDAPRFVELERAGLRMAPWIFSVPTTWLQKLAVQILVRQEKPDIIHSWMRRGAALAGAPNKVKKPVILGWFGGYYDPTKFKNCDHLIGVTKDIIKYMVDKGVPAPLCHFIPTFPNVAPVPPIDRSLFATTRNAKVLLALSRLHPKKGLDTLLMALRDMPDCVAWLAGDGPLRRNLETLAKKLNVLDRVRFLGWRTDRGALLRAADICVLPSRYEPFGTVILEAWAAGTPLVACASAGPAATIEDGITGILTPIDDAQSLADGIKHVLNDPSLRRALVAQGYAAYIKDYTREAVTQQWMRLYRTLIKKA
jgi:glycosyltransferase involved in cell wall biosynthesis